MRTFLMRGEDYYDEDSADVENENPSADKNSLEPGDHNVDA